MNSEVNFIKFFFNKHFPTIFTLEPVLAIMGCLMIPGMSTSTESLFAKLALVRHIVGVDFFMRNHSLLEVKSLVTDIAFKVFLSFMREHVDFHVVWEKFLMAQFA